MEENTIEQSIARLEQIIARLGDNAVTLDESLSLYTEGVRLSQCCLQKIESAEQIVEQHTVKENAE